MLRTAIALTAALALAAPGVALAGGNLVVNGNFASTTTSSSNGNFEVTAAGTYGTVANWSVSNSSTTGGNGPYNLLFTTAASGSASNASTADGAGVQYSPANASSSAAGQYNGGTAGTGAEYLAAGYNMTSPNGGNFMALDGDTNVNGYLSQSISGLTVGSVYELDFYWAVAQVASRTGAVSDGLQVTLGNSTLSTATLSIPSAGFSGWYKSVMLYTATSATETLSFLSIGAPAGYPPLALLDGVSLTAAPEPSTIAILLAGIGGLVAVRRRRTGKAASVA